MKRILLSAIATVFGLVALLSFKSQAHPLGAAAGGLPSAGTGGNAAGNGASAAPRSSSAAGQAAGGAPPARHGSSSSAASTSKRFNGSAVQTQYGVVQVAVTVTGQHIDGVRFLQLTAYDQHSQDINSQAGPILLQETMAAQNAHIDTVSGATYTSEGYLQSLQSALDQAGIR